MNAEIFDRTVKGKTCNDFIHPWNASCIRGVNQMFLDSVKGSGKFSLALHSLQLLVKGKNLTRQHVKNIIEPVVRMSLLGPGIAILFNGVSCLQWNLFGKFIYLTSMSVPGFASGAAIFIMPKVKRHYVISAFSSGALETFLNYYTPLKTGSRRYRKTLTFLFMLINGVYLYLIRLWKTNKTDKVLPEIWFYSPAAASSSVKKPTDDGCIPRSNHPCNHLHSCFKSILKETSNYFWFGTILEILRITMSNFRTMIRDPKTIIKFLIKKSTLKLAAFASLYVFLFKTTNCVLCRISGKDDAINALVSGFVSGLSYYIHPNLTLALTAFTNLIHISWKYFNLNKFLGAEFPTSELTFMFVCGFLFHYRMKSPESTSKFFINVISLATSGRSDEMFEMFSKSIQW